MASIHSRPVRNRCLFWPSAPFSGTHVHRTVPMDAMQMVPIHPVRERAIASLAIQRHKCCEHLANNGFLLHHSLGIS